MMKILNIFKDEKGVTILLTLIILSFILATAMAAAGVVAFQIRLARDVADSAAAIAAADAGVEWQLYNFRNSANDDPTAAMLTQNGLAAYNPINIVDNDTGTVGWNANSAVGSWLGIDLGAGNEKNYTKARFFLSSAGNVGSYKVRYSNDNVNFTDVVIFTPTLGGWNTVAWNDAGSHQYWRFEISAGPGSPININEVEMYPGTLSPVMLNGATFVTNVTWGSPTVLESLGIYRTARRKFRLTF